MAGIAEVLQDVGVAEVIVKLRKGSQAELSNKGALSARAAVSARPNLMSLFLSRAEVDPSMINRGHVLATAAARPRNVAATLYPKLGLAAGLVDSSGAAALEAHPDVQSLNIAPEFRLIRPYKSVAASAPKQATWGLEKLRIPELWERGLTGNGVVVGHLDTGVDGSHPALKGAISEFVEFDYDAKKVSGATAHDSARHGTHTAGTIVGRPIGGKYFGVAHGATLASGLVIENGQVVRRVLSGMEWLVGKVRILGMSLGLSGYWTEFKVIVDALRENNVLPIIAVGNEGENSSRSPGNYPNVISVGAFGADGSVAKFSSNKTFGRTDHPSVPYIVGPGVDVVSCDVGGGYRSDDGTSMATPHIAGLAALLLQANPAATLDSLERAIMTSCKRLPNMAADRAGGGVPNAVVALTTILGGAQLPPVSTARRGATKAGRRQAIPRKSKNPHRGRVPRARKKSPPG